MFKYMLTLPWKMCLLASKFGFTFQPNISTPLHYILTIPTILVPWVSLSSESFKCAIVDYSSPSNDFQGLQGAPTYHRNIFACVLPIVGHCYGIYV